jgi:two-component system response regulator NreC
LTVHILIADDHKAVRDNLRSLLEEQQPYWELSEAANGKEAIELFSKVAPDVAVLDIVMEPIGGIAAAYEIQRTHPATKIIFMSNHYNIREASVVTRLLGAGAFVPKTEAVKLLVPTIKKLLDPTNQPA